MSNFNNIQVSNDTSLPITRENVENNIPGVSYDPDIGLIMFCESNYERNSNPFIKQCRGIVFAENKLILKGFSFPDEYTDNERDLLNNIINVGDWEFYPSYEGTLLRAFCYPSDMNSDTHLVPKWFLSTHRKLNAYESKWASKLSFGKLFEVAIEREGKNVDFLSTLDPKKQYMFLLRSTEENRIVCKVPSQNEPLIYHVGTFENFESVEDDIGLAKPRKLLFESVPNLCDWVKNIDYFALQGVVCINKQTKEHVKVINSKYQELSSIRDNCPSINFRYLQIRKNPETVKLFCELYPLNSKTFQKYEDSILHISKSLYECYVDRYIKKQYIHRTPREHYILEACHLWHKEDRTNNKISLQKVLNVINSLKPEDLNSLINNIKPVVNP